MGLPPRNPAPRPPCEARPVPGIVGPVVAVGPVKGGTNAYTEHQLADLDFGDSVIDPRGDAVMEF